MKLSQIKTVNQMTIGLDESGQLYQQNGNTNRWNKLAKSPKKFSDFEVAVAGIIATHKSDEGTATYILPLDIRTRQFKAKWEQVDGVPFLVETASNGTVFAGIGVDGKVYIAGHNLQQPQAHSVGPDLAKAKALAINSYGLYAQSGTKTFMAANQGRLGNYAAWQPCIG